MRKALMIFLNILLIVPFFVFYRKGAMVTVYMWYVWFAMTVANAFFSKSVKELIMYNVFLLVFATIGIFVGGQLYFKYVYWDEMGESIVILEMIFEIFYIIALTVVESIAKHKLNVKGEAE